MIIVTGSTGLIGSAVALHFGRQGERVVGIDNDGRASFFGPEASTASMRAVLQNTLKANYQHQFVDVRNRPELEMLLEDHTAEIGSERTIVVHAAAQPSHDWAATNPHTDFEVNALGTLNLLEAVRKHCPEAVFVLLSTNKVYGDTPNLLPFEELETRLDLPKDHPKYNGIDETQNIDQSLHSLFGVSKTSADLLTQEYGRYFGMNTVCLRCGCLTGAAHAGVELHGFLNYLVKCVVTGRPYTVFGNGGKQVRDNLAAEDVVGAIEYVALSPPEPGTVYNLGGGRGNSCSILEAVQIIENLSGKNAKLKFSDQARIGDHRWYIANNTKFQSWYTGWIASVSLAEMLENMIKKTARENKTGPLS